MTLNEKILFLNNKVFKNKKYQLKYIKEGRYYYIHLTPEHIYKFNAPQDIMSMLDIMLYIFDRGNN